jgi:hypothetical protein
MGAPERRPFFLRALLRQDPQHLYVIAAVQHDAVE